MYLQFYKLNSKSTDIHLQFVKRFLNQSPQYTNHQINLTNILFKLNYYIFYVVY